MCRINCNIVIGESEEKRERNSRLSFEERKTIQKCLNKRMNITQIAKEINRDKSVVSREIKRHSKLMYRDSGTTYFKYSAAVAEGEAKYNHKRAGKKCVLKVDGRLKRFIEDKIKIEKWSPEEVAGYIKVNNMTFKIKPSYQTIYYWIETGHLNISEIDLTHKAKLKEEKESKKKEQNPSRVDKSIHKRPEEIEKNEEFGHWEMDCVEGTKEEKETLLTLLERKTKNYITIKLKDKTNISVVEALDRLERVYGNIFRKVFKTITTDNGSNFWDYMKLEQSCLNEGKRFEIYYTDPYSAWQKGMNENCNGILRRFIPKGTRISRISDYRLETILYLINSKPRKILGFKSARSLYEQEINNIIKEII